VTDPYRLADSAAAYLREHGWPDHQVTVTLGSGWQGAADALGTADRTIPMHEVPGFVDPVAEGHGSEIRSYDVRGCPVLAYLGRTHLYEGHGPGTIVHGTRVAAALGCTTAVLTNANGSLRSDWPLGTVVVVRDHLNLTGTSPIVGARFVDLTDAYAADLRRIVRHVDPTPLEGVYAMVRGPHYETRAEGIAMARVGADVVGMSTALETIAAREAGMRVLALSVVTAVDGAGTTIDPGEVVRIAAAAASRCGDTIAAVIARLQEDA
jgi:purine-nucleoside phosphorylase